MAVLPVAAPLSLPVPVYKPNLSLISPASEAVAVISPDGKDRGGDERDRSAKKSYVALSMPKLPDGRIPWGQSSGMQTLVHYRSVVLIRVVFVAAADYDEYKLKAEEEEMMERMKTLAQMKAAEAEAALSHAGEEDNNLKSEIVPS